MITHIDAYFDLRQLFTLTLIHTNDTTTTTNNNNNNNNDTTTTTTNNNDHDDDDDNDNDGNNNIDNSNNDTARPIFVHNSVQSLKHYTMIVILIIHSNRCHNLCQLLT